MVDTDRTSSTSRIKVKNPAMHSEPEPNTATPITSSSSLQTRQIAHLTQRSPPTQSIPKSISITSMPSRDLDFAAEFGNKPTGFRRRRPLCVQSSILLATSAVASLFTYWWFVSRNPSCSSVFPSAASLGGVSLSSEDALRGEPTPRFRGARVYLYNSGLSSSTSLLFEVMC
jgi:hypothetical protein